MVMKAKYPKANQTAQPRPHLAGGATFDHVEKLCLHTTETRGWPGYPTFAPHLTYNPWTHEWHQHYALTKSATTLADPSSTPVRENRDSVIQVEIVAYCDPKLAEKYGHFIDDIDDRAVRDLADFAAWLHDNGGLELNLAPRWRRYGRWGDPDPRMSSKEFDAFRGIHGHEHASGNDHGDPGDPPWLDKMLAYARGDAGSTTPTTEGRPFDMAASKEIDAAGKYAGNQPLTPGKIHDVWISTEPDGTHNLSVLSVPTSGADLRAVLDIRLADGTAAPYGTVRSYFALVSYKKGTPTQDVGAQLATSGDTVLFAGEVKAIKDRSPRMRIRVDVPASAPAGMKIARIQKSGWQIEDQ